MTTWRLTGDTLTAFAVDLELPHLPGQEPDLDDENNRATIAREIGLTDYRGQEDFQVDEVIELDDNGNEVIPPPGIPFVDDGYRNETVIINQATGMQLRAESAETNPNGTTYLRVCDPAGHEIMYWSSDEWKEEPEFVIGAVLGALCEPVMATTDRYA